MSKTLSEAQVLDILEIPDFRHMTKDKLIKFASIYDEMDPIVAQKAIEQFPNFARMALNALTSYCTVLEKTVDMNSESSKSCMHIYDAIITSLQGCLAKPEITFEERKYYIEQMKEIASLAADKDTENKNFNGGLAKLGFIALGIAVGVGGMVLGGKIDFHLPFSKS